MNPWSLFCFRLCHFLLQGIFPTQGSNPGLPRCRPMLYRLSHQESPCCKWTPQCVRAFSVTSVWLFATPWTVACRTPVHGILQARMLEWVAMPSSRGSSRPRDQTHISTSPALAGRFFTTSTTWEAPSTPALRPKASLPSHLDAIQHHQCCPSPNPADSMMQGHCGLTPTEPLTSSPVLPTAAMPFL